MVAWHCMTAFELEESRADLRYFAKAILSLVIPCYTIFPSSLQEIKLVYQTRVYPVQWLRLGPESEHNPSYNAKLSCNPSSAKGSGQSNCSQEPEKLGRHRIELNHMQRPKHTTSTHCERCSGTKAATTYLCLCQTQTTRPPRVSTKHWCDIVVLVVLWAMEKMDGAPLKTGGRHENVGNRWKA